MTKLIVRITRALILSSIFLIGFIARGQNINPHDFSKVTDVLPPPPNAAALGKYGGMEVSLNTGGINKTVQLYTFKSTNITVPISLSYSSSGFRVDELPSRVGIGWVLNAGGVINRTILGVADGTFSRKVPPQSISQDSISYDFLSKAAQSGYYDTEPDIFSFNFNGFSGKFVYDENDQPVFLPVTNLKIEKNLYATDWNFKITTPDGLIYYFGGNTATETSKKTSDCGKPYSSFTPSAWYLKKIVSPLSDSVTFVYDAISTYNYSGSINQMLYIDGILNDISGCENPNGGAINCPTYAAQSRVCTGAFSAQGVILTEINSPKTGKITFQYTSIEGGEKLYTNVTVKDYNNTNKYIFDLQYNNSTGSLFSNSYSSTVTRPFLTKLIEKSLNGLLTKAHSFYYNKLDSLPQLHSFAQDRWGYFNGKNNYSSLAEDPDDFYYESIYPGATANRSPDANYAMRGLLSKIEYPTGGYDSIYYESNDFYTNNTIKPSLSSFNLSVTGTGVFTQASLSSSSFTISYQQSAKLQYVFIDNSGIGQFDSLHNKGSISVMDLTASQEIYFDAGIPNGNHTQILYFTAGHTYRITITANGTVITTNATLYYRPGSSTTQYMNVVIGGVRVKKVLSYTDNNAAPSIKKYYYARIDTLNNSSGGWQADPIYTRQFYSRFACFANTTPPTCQNRTCSHASWQSDPLNSLSLYPSGVTYGAVVEGFGENFENGAIEHTYTVKQDQGPINLMTSFGGDIISGTTFFNDSYYNGKELSQSVYKKSSSGQLIKVQKTENTYKVDSRKSKDVWGSVVQQRYDYCPGSTSAPYDAMLDAYNAVKYAHQSRWVYIDTVKQTFYDDYGNSNMVTYKYYFYDSTDHLQPKQVESKNSLGDITGVQSKYSGDFGTLTATDSITQGIKQLKDKWIIGNEIEKTIYRKDANGSNQRVLGSTFTSYKASKPLPDTIYQVESNTPITNFSFAANQSSTVAKDSRYKKQILFNQYDYFGNIMQQQKNLDVSMSYIWDYKSVYPIAQVSNAASSDIAYTSFEADGTGNWSISGGSSNTSYYMTGKKGYNLSSGNSISKSSLNTSTNYIVSYWSRSGSLTINGSTNGTAGTSTGGWTYYEHSITSSSSITISSNSAVIDELRLYPKGCLMSTATYEPLVGVTAQADANNRITYYEYDGFNRLIYIKDRDKNILKKICYNYSGQPEYCDIGTVYFNVQKTGNYTRNNCSSGYAGTQVTYTVDSAKYASIISQAYVDSLAQAEVNANGQAYANANGYCLLIYYNVQKSGSFTRNNCGTGYTGSTVTYTVAASTYNSTISQAYVDSVAQADVNANGQSYANANGTCTSNCNSSNCTGVDKKCINGVCSTGAKVYTSSTWDDLLHKYVCVYHYEWSDGSWSDNYTELSPTRCFVGGGGD